MRVLPPPNNVAGSAPAGTLVLGSRLDPAAGASFAAFLENATAADVEPPVTDVSFSRHAISRLQSRNIQISPTELAELSHAIDRLSARGARESLLIHGDNAFVVGVQKRTVITALTRQEAVGSIFTNIDSTLVVR